jgi:hypothetical protein
MGSTTATKTTKAVTKAAKAKAVVTAKAKAVVTAKAKAVATTTKPLPVPILC